MLNGEWDLLGRSPIIFELVFRGFQFSSFEAFLDLLWFNTLLFLSCVWPPYRMTYCKYLILNIRNTPRSFFELHCNKLWRTRIYQQYTQSILLKNQSIFNFKTYVLECKVQSIVFNFTKTSIYFQIIFWIIYWFLIKSQKDFKLSHITSIFDTHIPSVRTWPFRYKFSLWAQIFLD